MSRVRIDQLLKLLGAEPDDHFCLYGLGLEHSRLGEGIEARRWFDRAILVRPDEAYAYYHKAKSLIDDGLRDEALLVLNAGFLAAKRSGDTKAMSEIASLRDEIDE